MKVIMSDGVLFQVWPSLSTFEFTNFSSSSVDGQVCSGLEPSIPLLGLMVNGKHEQK